ncbi:MAG: hypothetical protein ACLPWD_02315 [Methanobacterium sp.]
MNSRLFNWIAGLTVVSVAFISIFAALTIFSESNLNIFTSM